MSDKIKKSKLIKGNLRSKDTRGKIFSILNISSKNVSIIDCNKGSIRSNHYHYTDWHYMYILFGRINYFFMPVNKKNIHYIRVKKNDIIFTPPLEIHATHFPVKTRLIVCSKNKRDKKTYENDTKRVDFIDENNINYYLKNYK